MQSVKAAFYHGLLKFGNMALVVAALETMHVQTIFVKH